MQALEMESLIGTERKTLSRNKNNKKSDDTLLAVATKKDFMTKVLIVAGIALFSLTYLASSGGSDKVVTEEIGNIEGSGGTVNPGPGGVHVIETPVAVPVPSPTERPVEETKSSVDETPVVDKTPDIPVTPPPTEAAPKPVPEPEEDSSSSSDSFDGGGKELFEDGEYKYSNFAKVNPLIDHPLPDDEKKELYKEKFGGWHFWDGEEDSRPNNDYMAKYPNRDIPNDEFDDDAWQGDAVFVNHYLNDAGNFVERAMEAIYTEYGYGKPLEIDQVIERMKKIHWTKIDLANDPVPPKYSRRGDRGDGGWTTKRSFDGLVRRLLHAMMTSDTFTVVMGGHSAAAGQGNHFRQSYMMQFHKVMEPVFARLGVKLITRNVGMGGLGTIQNGIGSGSIYGDEVDLLIWDSGMTEGQDLAHIDVFLRQGLIGGNRVPVVWGGNFELLKMLHEEADVDVGEFGWGTDLVIEAESKEHYDSLPYAVKGLKCKEEAKSYCDEEPRFCAQCWIDRDDGVEPSMKQLEKPKGQVKWHPGWRFHQLIGRNMAMGVLSGLQSAVNIWNENVMGGPPLDEEFWHVTDYYKNIRKKVKNLDRELGHCYKDENLPDRLCNTPMKARTQYTPRANPEETSLTSIIKPTADGYIPKNEIPPLYEGPDAHNTCFDLPEESIDVFDVVSARRQLKSSEKQDVKEAESHNIHLNGENDRTLEDSGIVPGKGWEIWGEPQGFCDGTYNAVCALQGDSECVLYGHHDGRGGIIGNEYSGWLVLTLKDLKEGLIMIKLHTWHYENESKITKDWKTVNNEGERRRLRDGRISLEEGRLSFEGELDIPEEERDLGVRATDTVDLPDTFSFEYAIDGKITTLSKDEFLEKNHHIQRVVEIMTILDDPEFTSEKKDVEVAIRMKGCGKTCTFALTHIYWA